MTKNRGSENAKFFVKKESFPAETGFKAENMAVRKCDILHKNVCFMPKFNSFSLRFSFLMLSDGGKKLSGFFTELCFF